MSRLPVLSVAGLVCLVVAAATVSATLGWVAAGVGCLVVEWRLS